MTRDQQVAAVLAEAQRYHSVREIPQGSNRGAQIDYWIAETGLDYHLGLPWCAAFVYQMGKQALGHAWPAPRTASVAALAAWGATKPNLLFTTPERGDVFLLWNSGLNRFAHTGFVLAPSAEGHHSTIEGNTNVDGSRDGYGVFARTRVFGSRDRFLRWTNAVT